MMKPQANDERSQARRPRCQWLHAALLLLPVLVVPGGKLFAHATHFPLASRQNAQDSAARFVTDEVGRRVKIPSRVDRIVSLAPNLTETLYALGLGDRLVGDTNYCDVPPEAKTKPHVGGPQNASLEAIVALRPDLVFATMINREETVDALAHLGIAVYTADPHTVQGMIDSVGRIADLAGAAREGAALTAKLRMRLDVLHARLAGQSPVRALFVVWLDPLITVGQKTFVADALRLAGAESVVVSTQNWPQLSFEEAVRLQPEYLVFAEDHPGEGSVTLDDLRHRTAWKDLQAVKEGHVAIVSDEIDRPDPGLVDAIEQLARELHPDALKPTSSRASSAQSRTTECHSEPSPAVFCGNGGEESAFLPPILRDAPRKIGPAENQILEFEENCGHPA